MSEVILKNMPAGGIGVYIDGKQIKDVTDVRFAFDSDLKAMVANVTTIEHVPAYRKLSATFVVTAFSYS